MVNKRGQATATLQVIIGIMLIGGGILYLLGQNLLGGLVAGLGLFIELIINWTKTL